MRVPELGIGASDISAKAVESLVNSAGENCYSTYVYTARDEGSLDLARETLKDYGNVEFKALDFTKDVKSQDFELTSFDLVITTKAFNRCSDIETSLKNIRELIKPNGRLLIQEVSPNANFYKFIMGFSAERWEVKEDDHQAYLTYEALRGY